MSHFTVLVIGDNIEQQLEKYWEELETAPYFKKKVTQKDMKAVIKEFEQKNLIGKSDLSILERFENVYKGENAEDWNNNEYKKVNGVWGRYSTYNPNSKWDWYQIGGRWANFFKLNNSITKELDTMGFSLNEFENLINLKKTNLSKFHETVDKYKGYEDKIKTLVSLFNSTDSETRSDSTKKVNIDFEGMRNESKDKAIKNYKLLEKLLGGSIPKITLSWEEAQKNATIDGVVNYDNARKLYNEQPAILALNNAKKQEVLTKDEMSLLSWLDLEDYQCSVEEFGQVAYNDAVSTYAVLKDGIWYQKGEMGWWGISNDTSTQKEWNIELNKLIDEATDDTLFTLVDCHI